MRVRTHSYLSFLLAKLWNSITFVRGNFAVLAAEEIPTSFRNKNVEANERGCCLFD